MNTAPTTSTGSVAAALRGGAYPFRAYLPQSVKIYPLHQLLPTQEAPPIGAWDPEWRPDTRAYLDSYGSSARVGRQLYLHIPFCPAFCHFCCLYKTTRRDEQSSDFIERFVQGLLHEIIAYGRMKAATLRPVTSIYFGGGTPSVLTGGQVDRLVAAIRAHLPVVDVPEITFEGMAHQLRSESYLAMLVANGVNRISYGVQTFQPELRRQLGRLDTADDIRAARDAVRSRREIRDLNFELMIGIPHQTMADVIADLDETIAQAPESTDVLFYNAVPGTRYYNLIRSGARAPQPVGPELLMMRQEVVRRLTSGGYHHATGEIFDRRAGHLDDFNGTHYGGFTGLDEMLALGPSSYGFLNGTVYQNVASVSDYLRVLSEGRLPIRTWQPIDARTARRRSLLFGLQFGVIRRQALSLASLPLMTRWWRRGLIARAGSDWALTGAGRMWYNMMQLECIPLREASAALDLTFDAREQERLLFHPEVQIGNVGLARELERVIEGASPAWRALRRRLFRTLDRTRRKRALTFLGPDAMGELEFAEQ